MNEEIKQEIADASKEYIGSNVPFIIGTDYAKKENAIKKREQDAFDAGANFILSKWQESEKWRKVDDELPEVDDHLQHSIISLLVKCESGIYKTAVYHSSGRWLEPETELEVNDVIEWKPIT